MNLTEPLVEPGLPGSPRSCGHPWHEHAAALGQEPQELAHLSQWQVQAALGHAGICCPLTFLCALGLSSSCRALPVPRGRVSQSHRALAAVACLQETRATVMSILQRQEAFSDDKGRAQGVGGEGGTNTDGNGRATICPEIEGGSPAGMNIESPVLRPHPSVPEPAGSGHWAPRIWGSVLWH